MLIDLILYEKYFFTSKNSFENPTSHDIYLVHRIDVEIQFYEVKFDGKFFRILVKFWEFSTIECEIDALHYGPITCNLYSGKRKLNIFFQSL